jgi:hypothetical protein
MPHRPARLAILFLLALFSSFSLTALPQYQAVVSLDTLFLSSDSGASWTKLGILKDINKSTYLISAARSQTNPDQMAVGTSFEGIWESLDGGKTWKKLEAIRGFAPYYEGAGFYDEVSALHYAGDGSGDLFFRLGYNGKPYRFSRAKKAAFEINLSRTEFADLPPAFGVPVNLSSSEITWSYTLPQLPADQPLPADFNRPEPVAAGTAPADDPERARRREQAADRYGIYISANQASGEKLVKQLDFALKNKLNSIVVDFKDELGRLTYDSRIPVATEAKAVLKRIDPAGLVAAAHAKGIYVIARIVAFKDPKLYAFKGSSYALWNRSTNKPWGVFRQQEVQPTKAGDPVTKEWVQIEHWVDQYSDFVHQYLIDIAKEAQAFGVDEIQFDYIRFPSDGDTTLILNRFNKDALGATITTEPTGAERVRALTDFLRKARESLTVPIGTDVYGFNGWSRMSYLGQDIQAFSWYVDVISPMMYPSHYALDFKAPMRYFDRASYIYEVGTQRARWMVGNRSLIRPYVQSFLIGGETKWSDPQFIDYLNRQVAGSVKGGASGLTLWNNLGNYYMVDPKTFPKLIPDQVR